ncbi:hypothetical protein [Rhodococcus sp. IEGM 1408]|uniref:hypothetical protein n=1 Tax=Rhodococcus sp. IEGM 1408 TaxID=3082220 RepID=UPI002954B40B|nr:hypothetical protein [Rhodococcus sp. IEGM 1408]MDV8002745.1 hypothetical protein [Rhodococcus sp. IEGM 1408]
MQTGNRPRALLRAAGTGALAGLAGAGVMTAGEKVEQAFTGRPNSFVPARTLLTLLGRQPSDQDKSAVWNHVMHYGTAASLGALRGIWAVTGIRGATATAWHTVIRLGVDQTLENATGVGAPPATWPGRELAVDVVHKAVFSAATGLIAERALEPTLLSRRGRFSH